VKSMTYRPIARMMFWVFIVVGVLLGYVGSQPTDKAVIEIGGRVVLDMVGFGQILTLLYFGYFAGLFVVGLFEKPLPLPASIADSVLEEHGGAAVVPVGAHAAPDVKG